MLARGARTSVPTRRAPARSTRSVARNVRSMSYKPISVKEYLGLPNGTADQLKAKANEAYKNIPVELRFPRKWKPEKVESTEARLQRVLTFRAAVCNHLIENGVEFEVDSDFTFPEGPRFLAGSFGTPAHPVLVPSWSEQKERIVGCVGGTGVREHDMLWHNVKQEKPAVCLDCGQTFKLVAYDEFLEWAATEFEKGHKLERWWHEP